MSDTSSTASDPLIAAIEQTKRDSFAAGWKAALEAMALAISSLPSPIDGETPLFVGPSRPQAQSKTESAASLTVGTTPHYVYQAVQRRPGMTGAEVIAMVHDDGHQVAEAQIRTALSRLEKRQLLANRHRKWFLR